MKVVLFAGSAVTAVLGQPKPAGLRASGSGEAKRNFCPRRPNQGANFLKFFQLCRIFRKKVILRRWFGGRLSLSLNRLQGVRTARRKDRENTAAPVRETGITEILFFGEKVILCLSIPFFGNYSQSLCKTRRIIARFPCFTT